MNNTELNQWLKTTPSAPDIGQWMETVLKIGIEHYNLETGIISRINHRDYTVLKFVSKIGNIVSPGDVFELSNTYCEAVTRQHRTITYIEVGKIPEMRLHPVYQTLNLESYIGSPIKSDDGSVIGTISFSSHNARAMNFSEDEIKFIEIIAKRLGEESAQISGQHF